MKRLHNGHINALISIKINHIQKSCVAVFHYTSSSRDRSISAEIDLYGYHTHLGEGSCEPSLVNDDRLDKAFVKSIAVSFALSLALYTAIGWTTPSQCIVAAPELLLLQCPWTIKGAPSSLSAHDVLV